MKRLVAAAAVLVFASAACNVGRDPYEPKFAAAQRIATTNGPIVFTVAPNGDVYYAELRANAFHLVDHDNVVHDLFTTTDNPDALVVDAAGTIDVAARTPSHQLTVTAYRSGAEPAVVYRGPVTRNPAHLALTSDSGQLILGVDHTVEELQPTHRVISGGWLDPLVGGGRGDRIWVADNAPPGGRERLARGRESDVAKRNRFASVLPPDTNPSGIAILVNEVLLCSKTHKKVYRLHIGLDDVARRRGWLSGLRCDRDIGVRSDGSLITAADGAIYKYPPR